MTPGKSSFTPADDPPARKPVLWLRRLGLAGVAFFFVKGLLWLIVPVLIARGIMEPAANDRPPVSNQTVVQD